MKKHIIRCEKTSYVSVAEKEYIMKLRKITACLLAACIALNIPVNASCTEESLWEERSVADENSIQAMSNIGKEVEGFMAAIDEPDASAVKITTAEDLYNIRNNMYGSYVLMNDIDLSGYADWKPIGSSKTDAFHGKLDGQGYTITGLSIAENYTSATLTGVHYTLGLFGVCDGAEIKNIALSEADVSLSTTSGYHYGNAMSQDYRFYVAGLAGYACNDTVIYNCHASGNILAKAYQEGYSDTVAGGLIGAADSAIVSYSYNECTVEAYNGNDYQSYQAYAGGLVGAAEGSCVFERSYNSGDITARVINYGNAYGGGLSAGSCGGSFEITNCFNSGKIIAQTGNAFCDDAYAGGIVGIFSGTIVNAYNSGSIAVQAEDLYGIDDGKAYAGGICGMCTDMSAIQNAASVQPTVSAIGAGGKWQYRIAYQGEKSNTLTAGTVTVGSVNDAEYVYSTDELKTETPYKEVLKWDFDNVWEMKAGMDYPQLRCEKIKSDVYEEEYIKQHLAFIEGDTYWRILNEERWAQIYWSDANTLASDVEEKLYKITDTLVDIAQLDIGFLFEDGNPYKIILIDYISDQSVKEEIAHLYKLELPSAITTTYENVEKYIKDHWEDAWGELSEEDIFWLLHYQERSSEEWVNSDFEKHISEIVYGSEHSADGIEKVLGITTETFNLILEQKKHLDNTIDWFNGLIDYSAQVAGYVMATDEFHIILEKMCENLPEATSEEKKYKNQLEEVIRSYTQYNNANDLSERIFKTYITDTATDKIKEWIEGTLEEWVKASLSKTALAGLEVIGWGADKAWKIAEYITKNGELQACREMLRANAYFEEAMYNTLLDIETEFKKNQTIGNARLFDVAFKFFKETEQYSMKTCIAYCETYQTAWLQAIKNGSTSFLNPFIEEVYTHKLFLYRTYCHGKAYNLGGKVITVACPTDVFVYDTAGHLLMSIENDSVSFCTSDLSAFTADKIKMIVLPLEQEYTLKIKATKDGEMSYSISEYDAELRNVQKTIYENIEIHEGETYTGQINMMLEASPDSYNLVSSHSEVIGDYQAYTEKNYIPITEIKLNVEKEILMVGETISVDATVIPDDAAPQILIWHSTDEKVASVSETGVITAVGKGVTTIMVQALYGNASGVIEIQVNDKEDILGDVDQNGTIDYFDAMAVLQYDAELTDLTEDQLLAGDVNHDGSVDSFDAVKILQYDAELIENFE